MLNAATGQPDLDLRAAQYRQIQNFIMRNVLAVPYVHTAPHSGSRRTFEASWRAQY